MIICALKMSVHVWIIISTMHDQIHDISTESIWKSSWSSIIAQILTIRFGLRSTGTRHCTLLRMSTKVTNHSWIAILIGNRKHVIIVQFDSMSRSIYPNRYMKNSRDSCNLKRIVTSWKVKESTHCICWRTTKNGTFTNIWRMSLIVRAFVDQDCSTLAIRYPMVLQKKHALKSL